MEDKSRQDELRDNPNNRMGKQFRCSELGMTACNWSVSGNDESDMMPKIEQHGREAHGITNMDDNMKRRVRDAIHNRAA